MITLKGSTNLSYAMAGTPGVEARERARKPAVAFGYGDTVDARFPAPRQAVVAEFREFVPWLRNHWPEAMDLPPRRLS
jgi:hypothetical protein